MTARNSSPRPHPDIASCAENIAPAPPRALARRGVPLAALAGLLAASLSVPTTAQAAPAQEAYTWRNVTIGGGGYVTGIVAHPGESGLIYLRTDVGGAYRWDPAGTRWIPITDAFTRAQSRYYGGESIAIDPQRVNDVYWAANKGGTGEIFRSTDRGATWTSLNFAAKNVHMQGNGNLRWGGERLVVDPNKSEAIYFGSRSNGLWKTTDGGSTWSQVPTSSVPAGASGEGVIFVAVDKTSGTPGSASQTLYAGVRGSGVYRSTNAGAAWSLLPGNPTSMMRGTVSATGTLWVTHRTGVSKYTGSWTNYTPGEAGAYGGLSVDPANAAHIVAVRDCQTFNCRIYRTTNTGSSWSQVFASYSSSVPWWSSNWFSAATSNVVIDPFNSGRVWLADWYGVWRTDNIGAATTSWSNYESGHEELVLFSLKHGPTGSLNSGTADVGGFRHASLTTFPSTTDRHENAQDETDLDFEEADPSFVARVGGNRWSNTSVGGYSTDNGATWANFSAAPFTGAKNGRVSVSATTETILWAPDGAAIYRSTNRGATWSPTWYGPNSLTSGGPWTWEKPLAADRVNGAKFYAYKPGSPGRFYRSTNWGVNWTSMSTALPNPDSYFGISWSIKAAPGVENEVWASLDAQGLWRTTDGGATWSQIPNVQASHLMTFGKPKPGRTNPTVFVYGRVDNTDGIFRSDDNGATWARINVPNPAVGDDPRVMEGDRQVYGRVYIGTDGRGIYYGEPSDSLTASPVSASEVTVNGLPTVSRFPWRGRETW